MIPLKDNVPSRHFPWVMWTLIALNGFVFIQELRLRPEQLEYLVQRLGFVPAQLWADHTHWPALLTSMFLHGGWLHVLGNMWTLYLFGDNVEDRMGPVRFLVFYLVCGVAAALAHAGIDPHSTVPTIGASGAIAGVLGAYVLLYPRAQVITLVFVGIFPLVVELSALVYFGIWFLTQLFSGTLALISPESFSGVAWWAHIGGFVAGMLLCPLFLRRGEHLKQRRYRDEYWPW